jgi:hypothetical protein
MSENETYGAFATIRIRFDGTLLDLADRLSHALNLSKFNIERSEYKPYEEIATFETLGWEGWLQPVSGETGWFSLCMVTEQCFEEIFHNRMHNLSPWFAHFVGMMCDFKTESVIPDEGNQRPLYPLG